MCADHCIRTKQRLAAAFTVLSLFAFSPTFVGESSALPWDYDMYRQQSLRSNEVARQPVIGTVPLGFEALGMDIEQAETQLTNPVPADEDSLWRGQRLWNANCWTCHGKTGDGKGPVGPQIGAPNLLNDIYAQKSDGRVYAVIYHGLRAMPKYGFKFSDAERWDIVNYLRSLQKAAK